MSLMHLATIITNKVASKAIESYSKSYELRKRADELLAEYHGAGSSMGLGTLNQVIELGNVARELAQIADHLKVHWESRVVIHRRLWEIEARLNEIAIRVANNENAEEASRLFYERFLLVNGLTEDWGSSAIR
jgi:hypothetical protein